jgi:hypothetical protein
MIEEGFIQLKNYRPHPTQARYMIFIYHDYRMACSFEDDMKAQTLFFEKDVAEEGPNKKWLYAVRKQDMAKAKEFNNLAVGKFRQPFISDPILKYAVLIISALLIGMAVVGYIVSN